ncbi:MAG: hypothetical protein IKE95_00820 [Methanobrevibacter sp.]|nr:hypothetical protein [Methanobrevibacter sp.]
MIDKKKIIFIGLIIVILASCLILIASQINPKDLDNYNQTKNNISNDFESNLTTELGKNPTAIL